MFTEKIVSGQVCYEADLNQFKKNISNWKRSLQRGISLIIDTNDEYDLKDLIYKDEVEENLDYFSGSVYKQNAGLYQQKDTQFKILMKTISMYSI